VLWIALHLPALSLESFAATLPHDAAQPPPLALLDGHAISAANAAAQALGVKPGLKRATALALAPHITLGQADPQRDAQALTAVAHAALAFTPTVVIQPPSEAAPADTPHTVLLEVQASLRYFGGLPVLLKRLHQALAPLGHRVNSVSARTALGAALLARVQTRLDCSDLAATQKALDRAPVWLLGPGRIHWEALQGMGLRTIADLRAVPRDGLARRFGEVVLGELDRALGTRPDPRDPIVLPATFESRLELCARADTTDQLLHGAGVLLARLVAWLSARHAFVRRFTLRMAHERRSRRDESGVTSTALDIALAEPSRDPVHLQVLLRERLATLQLPAPTLDLSLHADDIAQRAPPNTELFPTPAAEHEGLTRLIERLQARLGRDQVRRLVPLPDHRPECATTTCTADARIRPARPRSGGAAATLAPPLSLHAVRPVWLLQRPELLREREYQGDREPLVDGQPLKLVSGPERIESGWWDGERIERDYFIAELPDGALVWVYCSRVPGVCAETSWFLQGRFG
jgi:protein ImuB